MNLETPTKKVGLVALVSIVMALLFDYLFFGKIPGISVIIFISLLLAGLYFLTRQFEIAYRSSLWLVAPILFFSIAPFVRASGFLTFLNIVAVMGLLLLLVRSLSKEQIPKFTILDYLATLFLWPIKFLQRSIKSLSVLSSVGKNVGNSTGKKILKGVLMALPVLIFFGVLLSSADLMFAQFIDRFITFQLPNNFAPHLYLIGVIFLIYLGVLAYVFVFPDLERAEQMPFGAKEDFVSVDRKVETSVFLGLIGMLFLAFIGFQITYLFGGNANITLEGFTYAEYARRGFWELLVVAFTTLCILLLTDSYTKKSEKRFSWFTLPSTIITVEVLIIIFSALKRLMLYEQMYGMTTLRLYVAGFIVFLAVIFIILAIKLLWEKKNNFFAFGTLLTAIFFLAGFNVLNPDSYIVQKNITRLEQTGKIDSFYLVTLSSDAIPKILAIQEKLGDENESIVKETLFLKKESLEKISKNWQSYNISRAKALKAFDENK